MLFNCWCQCKIVDSFIFNYKSMRMTLLLHSEITRQSAESPLPHILLFLLSLAGGGAKVPELHTNIRISDM